MNRTLALVLAALAALLTAAGAASWVTHRYHAAVKRADDAVAEAASLRMQIDNTDSSIVTVTEYVDRVQTIRVKGDTIIKEVPRYVTVQADAACTVPVGFVRLHDAAATGDVLDSDPGDSDAAPSGVALSAVGSTVAANYTVNNETAQQLSALQATLRAQGVTIIGEDPAP
ncbi:hypothetical protein [Cupriavidus oxalaticus]|uniref:Phage related protein exported protein n=1 Tax=Cupriavidus oxalaticus TaxID=96344 RepID=A0A976BBU9_9BURK|nr:hypothetical protein [Cupriavidus oxalaticus]QRQ88513.1 hypothetical protein JTE91_18255 [Cupriavidus oxalaticus]QRQ93161.1 hypothetical protein JTE92_24005 [Cupriavidus oxalaticus]WQD81771.1 hypothetical protein U0036_11740 [Cupriavidus oxalaticus]SPC13141.1 putative phage related protein exported protein [Cupriavidus oxalaticus]